MEIDPKTLQPIFSGLQKFSSIDFPGKLSMTLFTGGCNFRCSYCHNPGFVIPKEIIFKKNQEILEFLEKRKDTLDAVVICGGEPTIHNNNLIAWIKYIKSLGYKIKLDTNATNPKLIQLIINEKLVDYFAVDYKAPINKYHLITEVKISNIKEKVLKSLELIVNSKIDYEIRSTIHNDLHSKSDIQLMIKELKSLGVENYYLQNFVKQKKMVGKIGEGIGTETMLLEFNNMNEKEFKNIKIRNLN